MTMLQFGGLRFVSLLFLFSYCWSDTIGTGYPYDPICLRQIPSNNSRPWRNPPPEERLLYVSRDHVDQDTNEWLIFERDDGSTKMGVITSWRYNGRLCDFSFHICGSEVGAQDNWLVSPYIPLAIAKRVTVSVEFTMYSCNPKLVHCRDSFRIYGLQTDNPNITASMINETSFGLLVSLAGNVRDGMTHNYGEVTLDVKKPYLFVAFRDEGACMTLFVVKVAYNVCPRLVDRSISLPETLAGSDRIDVVGQCVDNAVQGGSRPERECETNGQWGRRLGGNCLCREGYKATDDGLCEMCLPDTFKSNVSNTRCLPCPANSFSNFTESTECDCIEGWYRAEKDSPETDCTGPASSPANVSVLATNARSVSLSWVKPGNDGGRSDLKYVLQFTPSLSKIVETSDVDVTVDGLVPYTNYTVRVGSQNGVNELLNAANYAIALHFMTVESVPDDAPQNFTVSVSSSSLVLEWAPPVRSNGVIISYTIRYFINETDPRNIVRSNVSGEERELVISSDFINHVFQIQAFTKVGAGPFSDLVKPVAQAGSSSSSGVIAGIAAGSGVLLLLLILGVVLCLRSRRRKREDDYGVTYSNSAADSNGTGATIVLPKDKGKKIYIDPQNYDTLDDAVSDFALEIPASQIKLLKEIGEGEFGEVYSGTYFESKKSKAGRKVAVKTLKSNASKKNRDDFLVEASIMGQFEHPNVISLVGVVTKADRVMIVTEFMDNGSLDNFLKDNDNKLHIEQQLHMALYVARGMEYLTDMRFIHRDLATRNILVNEDLVCKVADFGLSREAVDENAYDVKTGGKIPVRWTAPEAITYRKFTHMSDVWSYGVLLWEIMSFAEHPYYDWSNTKVLESVRNGYRLPPPMNCPTEVYEVMQKCWQENRSDRPPFHHLCEMMKNLIAKQLTECSAYAAADDLAQPASAGGSNQVYASVSEWLEDIKMERYVNHFESAGLTDLGLCWQLNDHELAERVGVSIKGHRHKILKSINHATNSMRRQVSHKI